jgi:putative PIG3 family NAD(P)H quinone oxidoreductase
MRAILTAGGGPETLEFTETSDPVAGRGEVLLDVTATAVNRADVMQRQGNYPPPRGASPILGLECSGVIAALGEGVAGWNVGDEVCALLSGGGYAERVAVPAAQLMTIPTGVDLVSAAALPEVSCTVWSMVFDGAPSPALLPGEAFLVHGGSSGIGTMAIQLAKAAGSRVYTTAGSAEKVQACRSLGADVAINYREQDFADVIAEEVSAGAGGIGGGIDVVLDTIGAKYLERNVRVLATGGRISVIGMMGGAKAELNLGALLAKRASIYAASLRARPAEEKAQIVAGTEAYVWPRIAEGLVRPVIHAVLPLAEAAEAHRLLESSAHIGKVLLRAR